MTVDEALTWARATDNERWQLLTETRDQDHDRGSDYVRRRAACIETLAQEVERVREPKVARHQPCGCVLCRCDDPARCHGCGAKNCGTHPPGEFPHPTVYARYIQSGDVDSPVPTITTSAAYCPECVRLRADLARVTAERDQSATMAHVWETRYKVTFEAATHVAIERDALAKALELMQFQRDNAQRDIDGVYVQLNTAVGERDALRMQLTRAIPDFVARVNARAEAEMLAGRPIAGAHHRAIEAELEGER